MRIAVLMTSYNRYETTIRALSTLSHAADGVDYEVYLVDDASPDGTAAKIRSRFPSVHVIDGSGALFWARGMKLAWENAVKGGVHEFYLWLNDDVALKPNAIKELVSDWVSCNDVSAVIVGSCSEDECEKTSSYAATDLNDRRIEPNGEKPQQATGWFNGNCVLIPSVTFNRVGMISGEFSHARADYDYAERLKRAGVKFFASSHFVGVCKNDFSNKFANKDLVARIKLLWKPGYWNVHDLWLVRRRYHGVIAGLLSCVRLIMIVIRGGYK